MMELTHALVAAQDARIVPILQESVLNVKVHLHLRQVTAVAIVRTKLLS